MKTHSEQNKTTHNRVNLDHSFFPGKKNGKDSILQSKESSSQSPPFFIVQAKTNENEEINQKDNLSEEKAPL